MRPRQRKAKACRIRPGNEGAQGRERHVDLWQSGHVRMVRVDEASGEKILEEIRRGTGNFGHVPTRHEK